MTLNLKGRRKRGERRGLVSPSCSLRPLVDLVTSNCGRPAATQPGTGKPPRRGDAPRSKQTNDESGEGWPYGGDPVGRRRAARPGLPPVELAKVWVESRTRPKVRACPCDSKARWPDERPQRKAGFRAGTQPRLRSRDRVLRWIE